MLAVERGHQLSRGEVLERQHRHFSEAELFFGPRTYALVCAGEDGPPKNRRHFDLYRGITLAHQHRAGVSVLKFRDPNCQRRGIALKASAYPFERSIDFPQSDGSIPARQVGKIDIDGQTRHVADEEVDCGTTL